MAIFRTFIFLLALLPVNWVFLYGQPPAQITSHEAYSISEEILQAHACYKSFTPELASRTLRNYLEELDSLKAYFIRDEIEPYLSPSDELLKSVVKEYYNQTFTTFITIYNIAIKAIERRNSLESKIQNTPPLADVTAKEVHESDWATSREDLENKLLKIRTLQYKAAEKYESEEKTNLFFQRIEKRRLNHEQSLIGTSKLDQKKQSLTFFLKAFAGSLDAHTMYFTPQEAKQFVIQIQQKVCGIGVQFRDDLDGFKVVHIVDGGPAARKGGLKIGDKIIGVNHIPVVGLDIQETADMIRGAQGTRVILTLIREKESSKQEEKFDIEIIRDEIVLTENRYQSTTFPYGNGVIGYIALHSFYEDATHSSSLDIKRELETMKNNHEVKGLILDLRNNSGGLLTEAVATTGLFINNGVVAAIKDNKENVQRLRNLTNSLAYSGPMIVLINPASASASEIVSLALSDYGRVIVCGDKSYGKGSYQTFTVQNTNPDKINSQGEFKVTRGKYYTVGGKTPQLTGVAPDIQVPGILSKLEIGEQYQKFPLENDQITSMFQDDLSDVHPLYRSRMRKRLGNNTQHQMNHLDPLLPTLAQNSLFRINKSENYQNFLSSLDQLDKYDLNFTLTGQTDLQLEETVRVMKELIIMDTNLQKR